MDIVNSQILQENISRILSIIGIEPSPLNEAAAIIPFLLKRGDDLINFFTRDGAKKVGKDLLNKIKSGATDFTDSELSVILKNIDSERVASQLMKSDGGLPIVKSFPVTFENAIFEIQKKVDEAIALARQENKSVSEIQGIISQTVNKYLQGYSNKWLDSISPNREGKAFFNTIDDAGLEITEIAESFHQKMMQQFYDYIKINKPEWEKISLPKDTYSDSFRKMASAWTPNDIETIRRFIARRTYPFIKKQEQLQQEFIDVANEMGKQMGVSGKGGKVAYYEKKLADILSVASSERNSLTGDGKDMEILYDVLAPKIPAVVKQRLSREQIISSIVETLKKDNRLKNFDKINNDLKGVFNQWKELLPFNFKDRKSSFWNRWFQFVLKGTPETFEEITATLRKQGLAETLARKVAAGIVAKYTVGPLLVGTMRTLYYIGQELYQGLDNFMDYDLPGGEGAPIDEKLVIEKSWFYAIFNESFKEWTQTQPGLLAAWPWRTYFDNIWNYAEPLLFKVSSDEAHDNAAERLTTPEERRLIDDFENRRNNVLPTPSEETIPQDLLDSFDGELEYLKRRIYRTEGGLYALKFEPQKDDVYLINPGTGWSAVGETESGIQRNLKLTDPITITGFLNSYPRTQFESVIKNTEKTLTEQLVVPDEPNPTTLDPDDPFAKDIEDLEKKIETIKNSQTAQKIKDSWDRLWNKVEGGAADAQTQLKILILKQKIDAAARKVTPEGQTMNFVDCTGWNTLGCKSESIKKVQSCMNVGVSGNFDKYLQSELARYKSTYAFKEGFSDSDVQKICQLKQEEDRQEAIKREELAKQAQKAREMEVFRKRYPQQTVKATKIYDL
jgi:hypothetical protein